MTVARYRRLLRDLARAGTRREALHRIRRRAVDELRRIPGRRTPHASREAKVRVTHPADGTERAPNWYIRAWGRLAAAALGADETPSTDRAKEAITETRRRRAEAALHEALRRGEPLEGAVCATIRALNALEEWTFPHAWALAEGVRALPGGQVASALGHGLLLHDRRQYQRAWRVFTSVPDDLLARYTPVEAVGAALATGAAADRARARVIGARSADLAADAVVDLAGRFLAVGERDAAAALVAELRNRPAQELDARRAHARSLIEEWLDPRPVSVPPGSVPLAILDYRTPDHVLTSGYLGADIQTLALVGNLVRFSGVRFSGEAGLGEVAAELQERVRPELRLADATGSVHLLPVDRDFSSGSDVPDGTWMLAYGWHMHPLFDLRYDFPYHANIRPLFVSFHVNRLDMLSEEALDYLRRYGPVGCRDWSTAFVLLSAGVDAFFSGCITTTIDSLFPPRSEAYRGDGAVGVIDLPANVAGKGPRVRVHSHQSNDYRLMSAADGIRAARDVLAGYQRELDRAITGRLQAYLPLTSIGVPVEFKPDSPGDVRFAGLTDLRPDDDRLEAMRSGIRDLLAPTLEAVVSGASEDDVYALWRVLTRERVADAKARLAAPVADPHTTIDVPGALAASRGRARQFGPHEAVDRDGVTDIVVALDQNLTYPVAVLIESVTANAGGQLRIWILGRGLSSAYEEWLAAAFPDLPITFIPCDDIAYGPGGRPRRIPKRITISTMDRLLLPLMLEDVDRAVYLDVDTLVLEDVCRLARSDLGERPVAARDSAVTAASEWLRAGRHLDAETATNLRRRMARRDGYGVRALNAGVLVLDLARMRRDGFVEQALGMVEEYGLHDQDTLLAYVGADRCVLEPRWNALPILEDVDDPAIIHWASLGKPWEADLTYGRDLWQAYAQRLRARAGLPPRPASAGSVDDPEGAAPPGTLSNPAHIGHATAPVADAVRADHRPGPR